MSDKFEEPSGEVVVRLGVPVLDGYLEFAASRCRPNTVLAIAYDLKVFFAVVGTAPAEVTAADVLGFVTAQCNGGSGRLQLATGARAGCRRGRCGGGCRSCRVCSPICTRVGTCRRIRCRGDCPRGGSGCGRGRRCRWCGVPRTLPRILAPGEVDALLAALRTRRDRAMVTAMVLGGLRRCEVLGLRLEDLQVAQRRLFIAAGKGGRQRIVPISARFFTAVAGYLDLERPLNAQTDGVFVVLKGARRGQPLSAYGVDEILDGARRRAGLAHASCHELRHTCLTRLREAGMALEAVQAQAGHASIESTRIYLHLADDWLAGQYRRAAEAIDAQVFADHPVSNAGSRR